MGNATLNEIHPGTYQHAADKARELGRYSQADNLEAGAGEACGSNYNNEGVRATPKSIAYINGKYSCILARDGSFSTRGANYFSDVSKTQGWIQNSVPEKMKTQDMALARKIVRWWNEYGEKDIPVLKDWHSFISYNVYENMEKNTIRLNESQLRQIIAESVKKTLNEMEEWKTVEGLAHDLCDGFEDTFDEQTMVGVLQQIISNGEYSLDDLWRMNNEDSTLVYDIISNYYPRLNENESRLRQIVAENVKKVLKEEAEGIEFYREVNQTVPPQDINGVRVNARFQLGKVYLIFSDKLSEEYVDLKTFAKNFVHENNLNSRYIFDIKGFSDEHTLWVEVFRKNN